MVGIQIAARICSISKPLSAFGLVHLGAMVSVRTMISGQRKYIIYVLFNSFFFLTQESYVTLYYEGRNIVLRGGNGPV